MGNPQEYTLNMDAEVEARKAQNDGVDSGTSTEIAARISELLRQSGVDDGRNPLAAEKIQRDLNYQRQMETLPQPDSAPLPETLAAPELDRLEQMQRELEAAKAEATRWKKEFGRREGKVGGMESRIKELESRLSQMPMPIDVRAMTGRDAGDVLTAQEIVNLLLAQSQTFGQAIRSMRDELANAGTSHEGNLPLDLEAELVESHPWLTDLPRPQKLRAMQDILSSAGVTVAPQSPAAAATSPTTSLPAAAKVPVRQAAYIEPSNTGSQAEQHSVIPERQALNDKMSQLKELLNGKYKPGATSRAEEILAALGAGPVDETQQGFFTTR